MINITKFNSDGSCEVWDAASNHGGTLPFADIKFGRHADNTVNLRMLEVPCPFAGCDNVDYHPIGGGANAPMIQKLYLRVLLRRMAALGAVLPPAQRNINGVKALMQNLIESSDGPGRFRLEHMTSEDDDAEIVPHESE